LGYAPKNSRTFTFSCKEKGKILQGKSNLEPLRDLSYSAQGELTAAPKTLRKQSKVYIFVTKYRNRIEKQILRQFRASDT